MYIVTEFVGGSRDLCDIMEQANETWDRETPLFPVDDVRKLMRMILSGVTHMHANNIVHRDLKPANCLLDQKFELNIIDFGLAIERKAEPADGAGKILGTPAFMAPEIWQQHGASGAYQEPVDVWACGVTMY